MLAVLAFHGGYAWAAGGFLGVSLFFTLSGFLITSIVVHERDETGGLSLKRFWARRARRLLPASIIALGMAFVVTIVVVPAGQQIAALADIRAAALNIANWRFIWSGDVYADITRLPSPVQHYWSLAIEEQFYVLFPLIALVSLRSRRAALAAVFAVVIAWSVRQQIVIDDLQRVYFGTDTRASELALGGLLALGRDRVGRLLGSGLERAADVVGGAALVLTLALWWRASITSPGLHHGGFAAVGVVSSLAVFGAVAGRHLPRLLAVRPLVHLGLISYGVYLYHFPVYLALTSDRLPLSGVALFVMRLLVTLALAIASFWAIERPIRQRRRLRGHRSTLTFLVALGAVLAISLAATVHYDTAASADLARDLEVSVGPAVAFGGTELRPPHILIVGDSTAATMTRGLRPWGSSSGELRVSTVTSQGCATLPGLRMRVRHGYEFTPKGCDRLFAAAAAVAQDQAVDAIVVLIGSSQLADWTYAGGEGWRDITDVSVQRAYEDALQAALGQLETAGVPILWADVPTPDWDLDAFGELLGGPLPGNGPVVMNDPERVAIVNRIDRSVVQRNPLATIFPWTDVLSGPGGTIPVGLRFDGLHVDEAKIPELAEAKLLAALRGAYTDVAQRAPAAAKPPALQRWAPPG